MEMISNAGREKDGQGANSDTVSCLCKEEALPQVAWNYSSGRISGNGGKCMLLIPTVSTLAKSSCSTVFLWLSFDSHVDMSTRRK